MKFLIFFFCFLLHFYYPSISTEDIEPDEKESLDQGIGESFGCFIIKYLKN